MSAIEVLAFISGRPGASRLTLSSSSIHASKTSPPIAIVATPAPSGTIVIQSRRRNRARGAGAMLS